MNRLQERYRFSLLAILALGLGLGLGMGVLHRPAFAEEEIPDPPVEEESGEEAPDEAPAAPPEPEDAAPPRDFRPSEEVPFDMGIDFPVDI